MDINPMNTSIAVALAAGFLQVLRHALDADHLVAVSTIVSEHKSLWRSSLIGTFWGLGHTVSLAIVSAIIILPASSGSSGVSPLKRSGASA